LFLGQSLTFFFSAGRLPFFLRRDPLWSLTHCLVQRSSFPLDPRVSPTTPPSPTPQYPSRRIFCFFTRFAYPPPYIVFSARPHIFFSRSFPDIVFFRLSLSSSLTLLFMRLVLEGVFVVGRLAPALVHPPSLTIVVVKFFHDVSPFVLRR